MRIHGPIVASMTQRAYVVHTAAHFDGRARGTGSRIANPDVAYGETTLPTGIRSRSVDNIQGSAMHLLEAGFEGGDRPCMLLLHGFRSWHIAGGRADRAGVEGPEHRPGSLAGVGLGYCRRARVRGNMPNWAARASDGQVLIDDVLA